MSRYFNVMADVLNPHMLSIK